MYNMAESDILSDTESMSDTSDVDLTADFDDIVDQITTIQASYETSLEKLQWIQDRIRQIDPLDTILEEFHEEALKEIEETGESSFGSKLIAYLSQKIEAR
jgi:hypothetical protein